MGPLIAEGPPVLRCSLPSGVLSASWASPTLEATTEVPAAALPPLSLAGPESGAGVQGTRARGERTAPTPPGTQLGV